jgi:hypothetical protein
VKRRRNQQLIEIYQVLRLKSCVPEPGFGV